MMTNNRELDTQVARAMGLKVEHVTLDASLMPGKFTIDRQWLFENEPFITVKGGYKALQKYTTDPAAWYQVEQWMRENLIHKQQYRYAEILLESTNAHNYDITCHDVYKAATAPLPVRCRAFLVAMGESG